MIPSILIAAAPTIYCHVLKIKAGTYYHTPLRCCKSMTPARQIWLSDNKVP